MSLAILFRDAEAEADPQNSRGRSRVDKIRFARAKLQGDLSHSEVAAAAGVAGITLWRWLGALISDGQPDTDCLRVMHAKRYRRNRE